MITRTCDRCGKEVEYFSGCVYGYDLCQKCSEEYNTLWNKLEAEKKQAVLKWLGKEEK